MLNLPLQVIDRHVCEVDEALVTFSNIDQLVARLDARTGLTSRHLVVIVNAASPDAVAQRDVYLQFNGDTGANYNDQELTGVDVVDDADRLTGVTQHVPFPIPGTTYANAFGGGQILIPHAFGSVDHTTVLALGGAVEDEVKAMAGRWANVAAITSVTLAPDTGNFIAGSVFTLAVVDEQYLVEEIEDAAADFTPTFDNIPQGEGDLVVIGYCRSDGGAADDFPGMAVNDDTVAGNYPSQELSGRIAATGAAQPNFEVGIVPGAAAAPGQSYGAFVMILSQYTKGNQPHWLSLSGFHSTTVFSEVRVMSGRRANIEPVNKLAFTPNGGVDWIAGSLFSLYRVPKRLIERQVLTADQATITFDNIPQYYEALILHVYARGSAAVAFSNISIEFNDDNVLANYDFQRLEGAGAGVTSLRSLALAVIASVPAAGGGTGEFGGSILLIPDYSSSTKHKHYIGINGPNEGQVAILSNRWESTAPITKIDLDVGGDFVVGSVFELVGVLRKEGLPADAGMTFGV